MWQPLVYLQTSSLPLKGIANCDESNVDLICIYVETYAGVWMNMLRRWVTSQWVSDSKLLDDSKGGSKELLGT